MEIKLTHAGKHTLFEKGLLFRIITVATGCVVRLPVEIAQAHIVYAIMMSWKT